MPATTVHSHDYIHLIGTELAVGYADQDDGFAAYLPRTGTVARQIAIDDWGSDWLLLHLNAPFEYQLGSLETGFRALAITQFLVGSRWAGAPIGRRQTSVFLLIDPDHVLETKQHFSSADFIHICWGMIPP